MTDGQQWLERARREPDPNRADRLAAMSVQKSPQAPDAYVLRGQIAVHRGDVLAAAHHLRVAFARGARDTFTRDVLGLCLAAAGQPDLAARMRVSPATPGALKAIEARALQAAEAIRAVLARTLPAADVPGWLPGEFAPNAEEVGPKDANEASPAPVSSDAPPGSESGSQAQPSAGSETSADRDPNGLSAPAEPADGGTTGSGGSGGPITGAPEAAIRRLSNRTAGAGGVRAVTPTDQPPSPRREEGVRVVRSPVPAGPAAGPPAGPAAGPPAGAPAGSSAAQPAGSPAGPPVVSVQRTAPAASAEAPLALSMPAAAAPAESEQVPSTPAIPEAPAESAPRPMHLPTASTAPAPARPLRIHRIATVQPDWLDATPQYQALTVPVASDWLEDTAVPGAPTQSSGGFEGGGIELALDPGELSAPVRSPVTGRMVPVEDLKRQRAGALMPALDVPLGLLDARDAFVGQIDLETLRAAVDLPGPVLTRPQHPPRQLTRAVAAGLTATELLLRDRVNPQVTLQRLALNTFDRIEVLADGAQLSCCWSDGRALHFDLRALRQRAPVLAASFVRALLACAEAASLGRS